MLRGFLASAEDNQDILENSVYLENWVERLQQEYASPAELAGARIKHVPPCWKKHKLAVSKFAAAFLEFKKLFNSDYGIDGIEATLNPEMSVAYFLQDILDPTLDFLAENAFKGCGVNFCRLD